MVFTEDQEDNAAVESNSEKAVKPIPINPGFLHYLWLLATEIPN